MASARTTRGTVGVAWLSLGALGALCALFTAACESALPEELARTAGEQVHQARLLAGPMNARWKAAMAKAGQVQPGYLPCPIEVVPASRLWGGGEDPRILGLIGEVRGNLLPIALVPAAELGGQDSPRFELAARMLGQLEYLLGPERRFDELGLSLATKDLATAGQYAAQAFWSWDLLVIVDQAQPGQPAMGRHGLPATQYETQPGSMFTTERTPFSPGTISGRALLYSYEQDAFVCAGAWSARNSANLRSISGGDLTWLLKDDLEDQALREAIRSLKATVR